MAGVQAATPVTIQGKDAGILSLSGRRSFADLFESGNEQYSLWPAFQITCCDTIYEMPRDTTLDGRLWGQWTSTVDISMMLMI